MKKLFYLMLMSLVTVMASASNEGEQAPEITATDTYCTVNIRFLYFAQQNESTVTYESYMGRVTEKFLSGSRSIVVKKGTSLRIELGIGGLGGDELSTVGGGMVCATDYEPKYDVIPITFDYYYYNISDQKYITIYVEPMTYSSFLDYHQTPIDVQAPF